jgi:hypothetical protein
LPRLHLNERDGAFALNDEIDVPMPVSKSSLNHTPTVAPKPPLRDPLSELSKRLPGR